MLIRRGVAALAIAAAAWGAAPLSAQEGAPRPGRTVVVGQVVDAQTKAPIAGAVVTVPGTRDTEAVTGPDGQFRLRLRMGTHVVAVSRLGYTTAFETWEVEAASVDAGMIELEPDAVALEALKVSVDRLERERRMVAVPSRSFGIDELARSATFNALDFLQMRGGAWVVPCSVSSGDRGCVRRRGGVARACVVVDDAPMPGGLTALSTYQTAEFARMHVYQGGSFVQAYTQHYLDRLARSKSRPMSASAQMMAYCGSSRG